MQATLFLADHGWPHLPTLQVIFSNLRERVVGFSEQTCLSKSAKYIMNMMLLKQYSVLPQSPQLQPVQFCSPSVGPGPRLGSNTSFVQASSSSRPRMSGIGRCPTSGQLSCLHATNNRYILSSYCLYVLYLTVATNKLSSSAGRNAPCSYSSLYACVEHKSATTSSPK